MDEGRNHQSPQDGGASLARTREVRTGEDRTKPAASRPAHPRGCPLPLPRPGSQVGERPEAGRAEGPGPGLGGCRPRSPSLSCHRRPLASGLCGARGRARLSKGPRADPEGWGWRPRGARRPISRDLPPSAPPLRPRARSLVLSPRMLPRFQASRRSPGHRGARSFLVSVEDKAPRFSRFSYPAPLTSSWGSLSSPQFTKRDPNLQVHHMTAYPRLT